MTENTWDFAGVRALFINCTLKRSPEFSNTQALVDASRTLIRALERRIGTHPLDNPQTLVP